MGALKHMAVWRELRSPRVALLLVTLAICLVRARNQPSVVFAMGSTDASVVPGDLLLVALGIVAVTGLARPGSARVRLPRSSWIVLGFATAFCLLVLATGAANGWVALVSGAKLVELAALGLGAAVILRTVSSLEAIVDVLILFTIVADTVGLFSYITGGGRQASFLGEHDFAAIATLVLLYGLARVLEAEQRARSIAAIVAGSLGCMLPAALASLLGLYLGAAVLLLIVASRHELTRSRGFAVAAVVAVVTAGTLGNRAAGDLGFLQSWFGKPASRPGQYASGWSQRLIYAYIGGRVFTAHPLLGTGWYGELPPRTFTAYLPAARRRFSDQPASYFPPPDRDFIPQQTWDQVLYELGIVGGAIMLGFVVSLGRAAAVAARRARRVPALLPAAWLAASIGALAGEGLFGGTPLAATFWLSAGVVVALSARTLVGP